MHNVAHAIALLTTPGPCQPHRPAIFHFSCNFRSAQPSRRRQSRARAHDGPLVARAFLACALLLRNAVPGNSPHSRESQCSNVLTRVTHSQPLRVVRRKFDFVIRTLYWVAHVCAFRNVGPLLSAGAPSLRFLQRWVLSPFLFERIRTFEPASRPAMPRGHIHVLYAGDAGAFNQH